MITTSTLYKENKYSFWFILILWAFSIYFLATESKGFEVLYFNAHRTLILNSFFTLVTQLAEGFFCVLTCLLVLVWSWKKGLLLSLSLILNSLLGQFLKRFVFTEHHRPSFYFSDQLNEIRGYEYHTDFSFPSGHTIAGVTLFFVLSLFFENKYLKLGLVFSGCLVALSRMYLAQHFLEDVFFGSLIAIFLSSLYCILYSRKMDWK